GGSTYVGPAARELLAERREVVDLAVEDGHDVAGLVRDRLRAGQEVDDLQTPVAEDAAAKGVHRALVGTSVRERSVHALDQGGIGGSARCDETADPAHGTSLYA